MRKISIFLLILMSIQLILTPKLVNALEINYNGKKQKVSPEPYIDKQTSTTMVPLRFFAESLGWTVSWNNSEQKATLSNSSVGEKLVIKVGDAFVTKKDQPIHLVTAAVLKNGTFMLPLRNIAELLSTKVAWDVKSKRVSLETKEVKGKSPLRAVWISTVYNIDWPSKMALDIQKQKQEFIDLLDISQKIGLNAVIVQVRPSADAFYPSQYVPWSRYLMGKQGKDPGYDPLAFMIEETHARNMEFHAWFNPFRVSVDTKVEELAISHAGVQNPEWIINHENKLMYDPGIPKVRAQVTKEIMEVVENYNVDGIHLDDYFYPSTAKKNKFPDDRSYKLYNPKKIKDKEEWRRQNINEFIRDLSEEIKSTKPDISFGISPFGVWRNKAVDPTGSDTQAGISNYDNLYADIRTWIRNEWIDYIAPQIYWHIGHSKASYDTLVKWWAKEVANYNVKLYIGHAAYKLGIAEGTWKDVKELNRQMDYNRQFGEVKGDIFFSARVIKNNVLSVQEALKSYWHN